METFSVKKPFTVLVGVIMVLVLGFVSLTSMAMDLLPSISMPMLIVITTYPGASAEKVESDVTTLLESSLGTITGVTDVSSTSAENYSMVQLTFEDDTDMDSALVKVSSAVQTATSYLPDDCGVPSIMEISMDMLATMYVAVSYEGYDVYELSSFVSDTVTPTLERVEGVASVSEVGLVEKTIYVELNQEKIDDANERILVAMDDSLAEALEALDEADAEVADAQAELEEAQSTFGEVFGDEIAAALEDPVDGIVLSLQDLIRELYATLDGATIDTDSLTGSTDTTTDTSTTILLAAYSLTGDQQDALIKLLDTVDTSKVATEANATDDLTALLKGQLDTYTADTSNATPTNGLGLTADDVTAITTMLNAMGETTAAASIEAIAAVDTSTATSGTALDQNAVTVEALYGYLATIETGLITAADASLTAAGAGYTVAQIAASSGISEADAALSIANSVGAALATAATESVTSALTSYDASSLTDAISSYNESITSAKEQISALYGQTETLPDTVSSLVSVYGAFTQIQLEAAVGFSTATVALTTAESELSAARAEYDAAVESALANANMDALLDVSTLAQLIYAQNFSMPAGYIDDADDNTWLLKVGESYESTEALSDALLLTMDGVGDITISDVADVVIIDNADLSYARLNGEYAVIMSVYKSSTAGTNDVSSAALEAMDTLEEKYTGVQFVTLMDQGDYITLIIDSVVSSMAVGAFLAILVLAIFLKDIMPTLVVGVSIPLSVLFAVVLMYFTGLSLNIMTLCGLALGIGMLVDNSVVVIENIYRLRGRGIGAARAAVQATRQVSGAIVASTLTTICVFLPLVFTSGTVRELLMPMGLSIAYCLFASLAVALTVVPATASTLLRNTKPKDHPWFEKVQELYGISLEFCLRVKAVPLSIAMGLLLLCVWQVFQMGIVVIPEISSDEIEVSFTTAAEATREESYAEADAVMMAILEIENVSDVGVMSDSDSASLLGFSSGSDSYGSYTYYVSVSENAGSGEINQVCDDIEAVVAELGYSATAAASGMSDMTSMTASGLTITIEGDDVDVLSELTGTVAALIDDVEGYGDIYNSVGEGEATLQLNIDKDKAMEYGFTVVQIFMQISSYLTDEVSSTSLTVDGESMTVVVQDLTSPLTVENLMDMEFEATSYADSGSSFSMDSVSDDEEDEEDEDADDDVEDEKADNIYLLSDFASVEETTSVVSISRQNQSRYVTVSASTLEGYNATLLSREVTEIIDEAIADGTFPDGYTVSVGGESDEVYEMVEQMLLMVLLALVFIYLVMVAQFQSLLSPFIVLFTIPLAFTGGLLALLLTGDQLSLISIMGFLVLMGTVVNNGIVFVDYTNQLRIGGMTRADALVATGKTRMRPIFMTAITTILAMVQLMTGDDMASQMAGGMAIVIAGGLLYATLMTLYIIPVMYDILFKRQPLDVDVGSEDLDDIPDDAAAFIAEAKAKAIADAVAAATPEADLKS